VSEHFRAIFPATKNARAAGRPFLSCQNANILPESLLPGAGVVTLKGQTDKDHAFRPAAPMAAEWRRLLRQVVTLGVWWE
jgi:hypothetical protein